MKQADQLPAGVVSNAEIAAVMREIGDLLELQGANPFRIRAYRKLALTLDTLAPSVQQMLAAGDDLERLPGGGPDLAGKMAEVVASGSCAQLDELRHAFPPGLPQLLDIPGLGPRKVAALYREGGIASTAMLAEALRDGRLARLRGFGGHCAERLRAALAAHQSKAGRFTRPLAAALAAPLLDWLRAGAPDGLVELAGSYRRGKETVGDLDIVAHTGDATALTARLARYGQVRAVLAQGPTRQRPSAARIAGRSARGAGGQLWRGPAVLHGFA